MTVNTGRPDYDATIRMPQLREGEGMFPLRGQDELAAGGVRAWACLAFHAGVDCAVVEQALQRADRMALFEDKKLPDAGHLTEPEARQLRYEFARRAWNARDDATDLAIVLAEERALTAAMASLRPLVRALLEGAVPQGEGWYAWKAKKAGDPDPFVALKNLRAILEPAVVAGGRLAAKAAA